MSLKTFHIGFILAASALAFLFGMWSQKPPQAAQFQLLGYISFVVGVGLVVYLGWAVKKLRRFSALTVLGLALMPTGAEACSVCYGNPNAPMTVSANTGILFMLGIVAFVLVSFASLFAKWSRRSRIVDAL